MDVSTSELNETDRATVAANLRLATGGAAPHHAWQMMADLADAAGPGGAAEEGEEAGEARVVAAIEAAMALAPRDPLEAMLVAQMAAVHAAAMRALGRAAECTEHPQIENLYLRTAARLMNLFVRQTEALDRRARRLGRGAETADGAGASGGADGAEVEPDGREILDTLLADVYARMRERRNAEAEGDSGEGGRDPGPSGGPDP